MVLLTGLRRARQLCGPRAGRWARRGLRAAALPAGQTDTCPEGRSVWEVSLVGEPHTCSIALPEGRQAGAELVVARQVPHSCVIPRSWES